MPGSLKDDLLPKSNKMHVLFGKMYEMFENEFSDNKTQAVNLLISR
jgi:hypothetical protein